MNHLKPREYYEDLYDKHTVEECRRHENSITGKKLEKYYKEKKKGGLKKVAGNFNKFILYFVQGERYAKKEETIQEWMNKDEERDRFFETAQAPTVRCLTCKKEMFVSSKNLETYLDEADRVMFIYDCPNDHLPRRIFYDNGEEWKREKPRCMKCQTEVIEEDQDTEDIFKTVSTCPSCGHVEVSEIERTANKKPKEDPDYEKDRAKYCDPNKGLEYVQQKRSLEELNKMIKKSKEKEKNKELYDKVEKLKKLSIPQVKEHLSKKISKTQFKNLTFEKPDMGRIVSVTFNIEDPTDTDEYNSRTKLTKTLKKALEETNWRLMSDVE